VSRVAWTVVDEGLPVVQCVVVHRGELTLFVKREVKFAPFVELTSS